MDRLLTPKETADILGITVAAVRVRIKRRQLPSVKMGRQNRIPESALQAYIASLPTFGPVAPANHQPAHED